MKLFNIHFHPFSWEKKIHKDMAGFHKFRECKKCGKRKVGHKRRLKIFWEIDEH